MTINLSDNSPRISYSVADGVTQTSFTVPFEFFDDDDLNVYVDGTLKTLTTDYTTTGGDGSTGTVSISVTGASGGSTVVITRDIDIERTTDFPTSGPFQIAALNTELDRITAIAADLDDRAARALQLTDYDAAANLTLPDLDTRKGKTLAFNLTTGAVEAGPSTADVQSVSDTAADIALLADIEDGTLATNAITNVNTIRTDVTTVAANNANVTTVANANTNIDILVAKYDGTTDQSSGANLNITQVDIVADNIASVNTVATNISDVVAVAADLAEVTSEIVTVADDLNEATSEIDTVATNITSVNTVGGDIANVNTVAGEISPTNNISTVAGVSTDIAALADIEDGTTATNAISNVAGVTSEITTVAGQISPTNNISTVAGISTEIQTVAGASTNIGTVATDISNINSVAGNSTNINAVAGNETNINAVAGDATDIGTVATDLAGSDTIGTVAGAITNVNTVATNITGVNSFAERYRVEATNPTTSLDAGDLAYVTGDSVLKYYNGTSWQSISPGIGAVSDDSNPSLGGNLNLASSDITGTGNIDITGSITSSGAVIGSNNVVTAVASGALANGDVVCLNSDGTVSVASTSDTLHSTHEAEFATGNGIGIYAAVDPTTGKILVLYNTTGILYGRLVAGQINGKTITFGTPIAFNGTGSALYGDVVFDPNEKVFIVAYRDGNNSNYGTARVCTIDGLTVTAGSEVVFESATTILINAVYDTSNEKVVITYRDSGNSDYGTAVVGTVSGGAITFGTPVVYESNFVNHTSTTFDSTNNKVVHVYEEGTTGYAIIGTVSGTSISFGTRVSFATGGSDDNLVVFDSNAGKVAVAYENSGYNGIVGTVSGTSISFGTAVNFSSDFVAAKSIAFDTSSNEVIVVFYEFNNDLLKVITGTISGTSITFGTAVTISSQTNTSNNHIVFDPTTNKNIILYENSSDEGYGVVFETNYSSAEDYIGISNAAYSDGATATIQIVGSVDDAQSGLVEQASYFVADDGSLSLINNGRKIGKAISATELLIDTSMSGAETNAYLGSLI